MADNIKVHPSDYPDTVDVRTEEISSVHYPVYIAADKNGNLTDATNPQFVAAQFVDENGAAYGVKHIGNKPRVSAMPYLFDIAEGNVSNHTAIIVNGHNPDVGTSDETIWQEGGAYAWPTSAAQLTVSSSDANDDSGGSGAETVTVYGLDEDYEEINETVTLDGQTGVTTTNSYLRIQSLQVASAGATGSNEGIVYIGTGEITDGKPATVYGLIAIGHNRSEHGWWTVPAGNTFYMVQGDASTDSNKGTEIDFYIRESGGLFTLRYNIHLFSGNAVVPFTMPFKVEAKSDIEVRAVAAQAGGSISAVFHGWYET